MIRARDAIFVFICAENETRQCAVLIEKRMLCLLFRARILFIKIIHFHW